MNAPPSLAAKNLPTLCSPLASGPLPRAIEGDSPGGTTEEPSDVFRSPQEHAAETRVPFTRYVGGKENAAANRPFCTASRPQRGAAGDGRPRGHRLPGVPLAGAYTHLRRPPPRTCESAFARCKAGANGSRRPGRHNAASERRRRAWHCPGRVGGTSWHRGGRETGAQRVNPAAAPARACTSAAAGEGKGREGERREGGGASGPGAQRSAAQRILALRTFAEGPR